MSVWIRIALRYAAGALVARGLIAQDVGDVLAGDPDVLAALETLAGLAIAAGTEFYYRLAKQYGWPT